MAYDVGTMVLSDPYYVGNHEQVVGWVINAYEDYCIVQWASDKLPTSIVTSHSMDLLHKSFLDLEHGSV